MSRENPLSVYADIHSIDDAIRAGEKSVDDAKQEYNNVLWEAQSQHDECVKEVKDAEEQERWSAAELLSAKEKLEDIQREILALEEKANEYAKDGKMDAAASERCDAESRYAEMEKQKEIVNQAYKTNAADQADVIACKKDEELTKEILDNIQTGVYSRVEELDRMVAENNSTLTGKRTLIADK